MNRFWSKVDMSGGPEACWPWMAYRDQDGYGRFWVGDTQRPALSVALELHTGEPAQGRLACHSCDNTGCTNPHHGFWGTHADNHADRNAKQRQARGERQGSAKLTARDVTDIRARYVAGCRVNGSVAIARDYGVCKSTIGYVVRNEYWQGN